MWGAVGTLTAVAGIVLEDGLTRAFAGPAGAGGQVLGAGITTACLAAISVAVLAPMFGAGSDLPPECAARRGFVEGLGVGLVAPGAASAVAALMQLAEVGCRFAKRGAPNDVVTDCNGGGLGPGALGHQSLKLAALGLSVWYVSAVWAPRRWARRRG